MNASCTRRREPCRPRSSTALIQGLAGLPLAHIDPNGRLPLTQGIDPPGLAPHLGLQGARGRAAAGDIDELDRAQWQQIVAALQPCADWRASQPDPRPWMSGLHELERLARFVRDLLPFANNFVAFRDFYARKGPASFQVGTLYLDGDPASSAWP
jgi:hypothetical protein